ncbi:hypothetical protein [Chishuiella changwenlii]|uniref:hypothetical protein n=1 Tax=Chishuiella changwenlii TaxID=1434701 RepID=UPI002FD973EE
MNKSISTELSCIILLFTTSLFLFSSGKLPADDGFFYLQIAKNVVEGKGVHFNSLYATNGFHPLWELICIIIAYINPFSNDYLIFFVWISQLILFFLGIKSLKKYWNNQFLSLVPLILLVILFCNLGTIYLSEAFLSFFCLSFFLNKVDDLKLKPIYTGFLFSLIFLSRLDNVFILLFLGVYVCFIQQRFSIVYFLKVGLGFSILVIPYFTYNFIEFGSIVPVSGKIKSFFPHFQMGGFNNYAKILLVVSVIYLIGLLSIFKNRNHQLLLLLFTLGTISQLVYNGIFQSQIGQWYFVAQFMVLAFLFYDLFDFYFGKKHINKTVNNFTLLGCFIVCLLVGVTKLLSGFTLTNFNVNQNSKLRFKSDIEYFVDDLKNTLPSNSRIYIYDIPGKVAYYSSFDVIPADGLINNEQFSKDLNEDTFEDFLINQKIDYVIFPSDSKVNYPFTKFLAINTEIKNGKQIVEIKDPFQKKVIHKVDLSKYKEVFVTKNPLYTWQPYYDQVKVFQYLPQ